MAIINKIKKFLSISGKTQMKVHRFNDLVSMYGLNLTSPLIREKAMIALSDFMSALDLIARTFAKLEFTYNKVTNKDGVEYMTRWFDNNMELLLNRTPNSEQTPTDFKKTIIYNIFLKKRFFAYIYKIKGIPAELIPLEPNAVTIKKDSNGTIYYEYEIDGDILILGDKDVIMLNYASISGFTDLGFDSIHQTILQLLANLDLVDTNLTANTQSFTGVIKVPENIDEDQEVKIRNRFVKMVQNARSSGSGVLVLDNKWDYEAIKDVDKRGDVVNDNYRKDVLRKLSRAMKVPLGKMGYPEMSANTYKSVEELDLEFIKDAILPFAHEFVEALSKAFIPYNTNRKFDFNSFRLIQHDLKTKAEVGSKLSNSGVWTVNEIRSIFYNLPPKKGGDELMINSSIKSITLINDKMKQEIDNLKAQINDKEKEGGE